MSDEFKFQLSIGIPSGQQYEKGDMLNLRGNDPAEFNAVLDAFTSEMAQKCADAAAAIKAAYAVVQGTGATVVSEEPAQQQQSQPQGGGWGGQQNQQQSQPQNNQQQGGGSKYGGTPHPEGKSCSQCGQVLEMKKTSSGKTTWRCPQWRWNNGNPNNHDQEWG